MRFFTRYFKENQHPYHALDFFEVYEEAEKFDNEFYLRLYNQRKEEILEEGVISPDCIEQYLVSIPYTASALFILTSLPVDFVDKIVDTRVFLLYATTREVYDSIQKLREDELNAIFNKIDDYEKQKQHDMEKAPIHWKDIFNIEWREAGLEKCDMNGQDVNLRISTDDRITYDITLREVISFYNETNVTNYGIIYYGETLLNETNLELNLLTTFNEISIIAKDVEVKEIERG